MPFTPVKGKFCKVVVGGTTLPAVNWSLAIDGKLEDLSNFRDGRKKDSTLDDGTLTFSLIEDESATVLGTGGLRTGDTPVVTCYTNTAQSKFYLVPVCIGQITPKVDGQETHLKADVSASLNGTIVYPS